MVKILSVDLINIFAAHVLSYVCQTHQSLDYLNLLHSNKNKNIMPTNYTTQICLMGLVTQNVGCLYDRNILQGTMIKSVKLTPIQK